jgi:hypothetical protein
LGEVGYLPSSLLDVKDILFVCAYNSNAFNEGPNIDCGVGYNINSGVDEVDVVDVVKGIFQKNQ